MFLGYWDARCSHYIISGQMNILYLTTSTIKFRMWMVLLVFSRSMFVSLFLASFYSTSLSISLAFEFSFSRNFFISFKVSGRHILNKASKSSLDWSVGWLWENILYIVSKSLYSGIFASRWLINDKMGLPILGKLMMCLLIILVSVLENLSNLSNLSIIFFSISS